jgi:hypothetical protein
VAATESDARNVLAEHVGAIEIILPDTSLPESSPPYTSIDTQKRP